VREREGGRERERKKTKGGAVESINLYATTIF